METTPKQTTPNVSRRGWLQFTSGSLAAVAASSAAAAQAPIRYPDPHIISVTKAFDKYRISSAAIELMATGMRWAEGPAWCGGGNYLMWSDIPNDRQMRWLQDDSHVSVLRHPCGYSNGNTFDWQGRLLSCEHQTRRVVRYEHDGTVTVLAATYNGKPFNAPNDITVHPNGSIWFTDPGYGQLVIYEGGRHPLELKEAVYRIDPAGGKIEKLVDDMYKPNGICFSPDYRKCYICDTGATHYPEAPKNIRVYDVVDERRLANGREFISTQLPGKGAGLADGMRADKDGNIWAGCGWVGEGYDGVHVFSPAGERIGLILLPEVPANLCFGGPQRNRLFIAASQSIYSLYVEAQGAHNC